MINPPFPPLSSAPASNPTSQTFHAIIPQSPSSQPKSPPSLSKPNSLTIKLTDIFTIKRLILPLFAPPILFTIIPYTLTKLISVINGISYNNALIAIGLSWLLVRLGYSAIRKYAPNGKKCKNAIDSIKYKFEFMVLVCVSSMIKYTVTMIATNGNKSDEQDGAQSLSLVSCLLRAEFMNQLYVSGRCTLALFFLSLLIGSRFVGYFSIVQCPTLPIPNNPYQYILDNLIPILNNMLQPDSSTQKQSHQTSFPKKNVSFAAASSSSPFSFSASTSHPIVTPKIYTKPTIVKSLNQLLLHVVAGLFFASIVRPRVFGTNFDSSSSTVTNNEQNECFHHSNSPSSDLNLLFYASCAFTSAFIFMATYYTNNNNINMYNDHISSNNYHELSFDKKTLPMIRLSELFSTIRMESWNQVQKSGLLFYWLTSPLIASGVIYLFKGSDVLLSMTSGEESCPGSKNAFVHTISMSYMITFMMSLYMISMDIMTRKFLITRGVDFFSLVHNAIMIDDTATTTHVQNQHGDDENEIAIEDLVLSVILGGFGKDIVDDVACSRIVERDGKLIRPTKRKKGDFSKGWVPSLSHEFGNVDIESEEVRRNNVMMNRVASSILTGGVCAHVSFGHELLKYILLETLGGGDGPFLQDVVVPYGISTRNYKYISTFINKMDCNSGSLGLVSIVRGLCAYSGGMGEALGRISHSNAPSSTMSTTENETFYLPPCACQTAIHAVKASSRFIILNMKNEKRRLNRLSLLIPVVLQSTYKLRCGTRDYVHYLYDKMQHEEGGGGEAFGNFLTLKCPEMANVLTACDDCGSKVLQFMRMVDRSNSEVNDIKVDDGVKQWLRSLL